MFDQDTWDGLIRAVQRGEEVPIRDYLLDNETEDPERFDSMLRISVSLLRRMTEWWWQWQERYWDNLDSEAKAEISLFGPDEPPPWFHGIALLEHALTPWKVVEHEGEAWYVGDREEVYFTIDLDAENAHVIAADERFTYHPEDDDIPF